MLDTEIKTQLSQYLQLLENNIVIKLSAGDDKVSQDMVELVTELKNMSPKISVERVQLKRTPSFSVNRVGEDTGITFAGLPMGHEFTSLILALLQVSGRAPKEDEKLLVRFKILKVNITLKHMSA